ncbi:MAG: UDP-N-acetylglucosamine diphosphorylase/glucosamine-1-phosphate N-acetyltransferase [Gammaproteobacteria bacterium]|nr:UDP-N-acetylglucosamine diphosphorylase/glucosamine-1-phosphate N-acetyltransferase [Gammaproteobacteria bacterium]MYE50788.1 UDP-N-acetylglucosamine diphosphorylase/glucosamine-1-phosphate N-acetyltransferase [Gammaproteobacteria bacterium]
MATHSPLAVIVLAAGEGKRMASALPKALHRIGGRTLLDHVVSTAQSLEADEVLAVIGHGAEEVQASTASAVRWVVQSERLGTGHAVAQALPWVDDAGVALVLCADVPLVGQATLQACVDAAREGALALVTAELDDPAALGRIVRGSDGGIARIVEFKDADEKERTIREVNAGLMALPAAALRRLLAQVTPDNAQGEYYLTDLVALAIADGMQVAGIRAEDADEILGINDRAQLAKAERVFQRREAQRLMAAGVSLADPARLDVRGDVTAGPDSFIDANVVLKGRVTLGKRVHLGPGAVIEDADIGDDARIEAYTVIEGARIGARCRIGPFARLRPGTALGEEAKVGNFVETKNARLGAGVKASHLAYLGDADIGADSNIGAGAVTCNYDGADKHRTEIGDDVFIGTNATLVAPLAIESGAFIAAGSTITKKVGEKELAVGRGRQRNIDGWKRPGRKSR